MFHICLTIYVQFNNHKICICNEIDCKYFCCNFLCMCNTEHILQKYFRYLLKGLDKVLLVLLLYEKILYVCGIHYFYIRNKKTILLLIVCALQYQKSCTLLLCMYTSIRNRWIHTCQTDKSCAIYWTTLPGSPFFLFVDKIMSDLMLRNN